MPWILVHNFLNNSESQEKNTAKPKYSGQVRNGRLETTSQLTKGSLFVAWLLLASVCKRIFMIIKFGPRLRQISIFILKDKFYWEFKEQLQQFVYQRIIIVANIYYLAN